MTRRTGIRLAVGAAGALAIALLLLMGTGSGGTTGRPVAPSSPAEAGHYGAGGTADSWGPNEIHMGMAGQGLVPDPLAQHVFLGGNTTIGAGTTLTFVNDDIHPHNIVSGRWDMSIATVAVTHDDSDIAPHAHSVGAIPYPDGLFYSEILEPGQQWRYTFARPGTYPYFCSLHPGMQAVITVA